MEYEKLSVSLATAFVIYYKIKKIIEELEKILDPIVKDIEERAKDGLIDKADRKSIALKAVSDLEKSGKIKLNFFKRLIISKVIDSIASKLPDFTISKEEKIAVDNAILTFKNEI